MIFQLTFSLLGKKLKAASNEEGLDSAGVQRLELLFFGLNLGIKSNKKSCHTCFRHTDPHFRQDLTVLHCFQIKDVLKKTDRKI